ncbi:MAG: efflux RND transporter periplasmic adaptor subunit [Anaerolineae bacterium]|nr:efflux RND transporter periplasmic adaptor subunit [Anaerolineae bacterium]
MDKLKRFAQQVIRRKKTRRIVVGLAALLALAGVIVQQAWAASLRQEGGGEVLQASGIIQVETVAVASELGGRVAEIPVSEGDRVAAGDLLVQLDTTLLDAQIESAEAMVALAEAGLAQARAGARSGQVAVAEAQLAQAEAGRVAAQQAVSDTLALVENPQHIALQIAVTQAQLEASRHQLAQAMALEDGVEIGKEAFEAAYAEWNGGGRYRFLVSSGTLEELIEQLPPELRDLFPEDMEIPDLEMGDYFVGDWELVITTAGYELYRWINITFSLEQQLLPNYWWQAWVGVNAANAQQEGLEAQLAYLYAGQEHPRELEAAAAEAASALAQTEAYVLAAQAQADALRAGASDEQIAAMEARLAQAQTGLEAFLAQQDMLAIASPTCGTVVDVLIHPGEVAFQGASLVTIADLDEVVLTVYVPENRIGQVAVGQPVSVSVDSFPERVFAGQVSRISDRAEFTPRNVATAEERVNLVFAVEIYIPNGDGALKPGMPADVVFE